MKNGPCCERTLWKGRKAYRLSNGVVRLVTLTGGGHIAEFRFARSSGSLSLSPLWNPPWKSIEPYQYRAARHASLYGPPIEGKLLSGIAGHSICLDRFGPPSEEEVAQGLSFHGEAPSAKWKKDFAHASSEQVSLALSVRLPGANLHFRREIRLREGESVAYCTETVSNLATVDRAFEWQQHVSLGPPFLDPQACVIALPATRGITYPDEYDEGKSLLMPKQEFRWPFAPLRAGGSVDLTAALNRRGLGFVVGLLLNPAKKIGFIAALNKKRRLLFGYCFSRRQCPWVAIWEENKAIAAKPWGQRTQARGLEFGSTALPLPRNQASAMGSLWGVPTFAYAPAGGRTELRYLSFLAELPPHFHDISDIELDDKHIVILRNGGRVNLKLRASEASTLL